MWFEDASMNEVVEVLDAIGRLLQEPKSLKLTMPLAQRADALMCRVVVWIRAPPERNVVARTRDQVHVLHAEVVALVSRDK